MKKRIKTIVILLLVLGNVYLGTRLLLTGNQIEKTNILSEAVWSLSKQGYTRADIDNIDIIYNPIKIFSNPYRVEVKLKDKDVFYLVWTSDKTGVVRLEDS